MMHRAIAILVLLATIVHAQPEGTDARAISRGLVRIGVTQLDPDYARPWDPGNIAGGTGSGFILPGHRIMTNAHVVSNARHIAVAREGDSRPYTARVRFIAHDCDLAIIELANPGEADSFFADTRSFEFGDVPQLDTAVTAYGYPIGGRRLSVTRGIVSRIEFRQYAHSGLDSHLTIQTDAAINPGNSGGPVIQDGKVVGVAFQAFSGSVAQNVGYAIPAPVIQRFLKDIEDGSYDGYMELAASYMNLQNPSYRQFLGLPLLGDQGVIVTNVLPVGSAAGRLQVGDVLLTIDGHAIGSDGQINLAGEFVQLEEIVERRFQGDTVTFTLRRDGKIETVGVPLKGAWPYRVYGSVYDRRPRYLVFAGLVFQPITRNLIQARELKDLDVAYYYNFFVRDEIFLKRPELVVLTQVLPDEINSELAGEVNALVDTVNGQHIGTLKELDAALAMPADRYVIRLIGNGRPVVIDAARLAAARQRIHERYGIGQEKYLGEE